MPLDPGGPGHVLQFAEQRAGAADDQSRVRVIADHLVHRLDHVALPGERMQPLHVQQQVRDCDAERRARGELVVVVMPREEVADRRIARRARGAAQPELLRLDHQPMAVERDVGCGVIRTREEIRPELLRRVVPDLRPVERQDDRFAGAARDQHGKFRQQAVAVHVHDVGARDGGSQRRARAASLRAEIPRAARARADPMSGRGIHVDGAGERCGPRRRAADARRTRFRPASRAQLPSCHGSSALAAWSGGR